MNHECPAAGCTRSVAYDKLMCRNHWAMVPRPLQRAVWDTYDACRGKPPHVEAMRAAIDAVNRKLANA